LFWNEQSQTLSELTSLWNLLRRSTDFLHNSAIHKTRLRKFFKQIIKFKNKKMNESITKQFTRRWLRKNLSGENPLYVRKKRIVGRNFLRVVRPLSLLRPRFKCHHFNAEAAASRRSLKAGCRVARWFIFQPKIPIWVYFGGP
jgi:hypothetical protein